MPGVAFLVGSGRKLRPVVVHTDSRFRDAALLRYCTDYAFGFSMLDETGFYAPSVAHNAFPSRPWLRISVLHGHNPTVTSKIFVETLKVLLHKSFHYGIILQNCGGRLRTMPKGVGCVRLPFYFIENIHIGFDCVYIY